MSKFLCFDGFWTLIAQGDISFGFTPLLLFVHNGLLFSIMNDAVTYLLLVTLVLL